MPERFTSAEVVRYYAIRLPEFRQSGREWRGPCPLHHGKRDSFAINSETGDWYCHSDCGRGGSLIGFEIELTGKPLAEAAAEARALVGRVERQRKGPVVSTYNYVDEDDGILFQCLRHEPKDFSQRRPDGHGGWIWNLQGVRRILFRLPTLKDATEVLLAEGEKDVLGLVRLGFVATCNPMGAEKWRGEYSDQLAGKRIVIFPDNDFASEKHVSTVARCLAGKVASVRIAKVPIGKDVSDWIASGATREDIQDAIESAAAFGEPSDSADPTAWRRDLLTNEKGMPKALLANAITALRGAPE
jgi:DNA primase